MKKLALIPLLLFLTTACNMESVKPVAEAEQTAHTHLGGYELTDGSFVFINEDGKMRMTDKYGKPITMHDGAEMELKDGHMIMMKNDQLWRTVKPKRRHEHQKMK